MKNIQRWKCWKGTLKKKDEDVSMTDCILTWKQIAVTK